MTISDAAAYFLMLSKLLLKEECYGPTLTKSGEGEFLILLKLVAGRRSLGHVGHTRVV
jgi:hypothetical protein